MSGFERRKPAPADFTHWAAIEGWNALRARYRQSTPTLQRWISETGVVRPVLKGVKPPRPVPADFAEHAATEGVKALMVRYSAGRRTVVAWIAESGVVRPILTGGFAAREVPEDFQTVQHGRTNSWLRAHYGCGEESITRWRKLCNLPALATAPADFADRYAEMTIDQLRKHYGRGWLVIKRWITDAGLSKPKPEPKPKAPRSPRVKAEPFQRTTPEKRPARARLIPFHKPAMDTVMRDMSPAGQAADTLRRDRWIVFRCDDRGRANSAGKLWLCGRVICTDAELIERAERAARRMAA